MLTRRTFIKTTSAATAALMTEHVALLASSPTKIIVGAHLWVYASKYPPNWDCTPIIEQVFSDLKYANIDGVELMHTNLFHANAVSQLGGLIEKYNLPVIGSSYSANMWDKKNHYQIEEECGALLEKLHQLKAKTFGITVGDAGHKKTEEELDAQAEVLKTIRLQCIKNQISANLHNHTYEVTDSMYDLKGTLKRIPDFPLGPDLNWLIRGGVDPVKFIQQYKKQIVYLHLRDQYKNGEWSEAVGEGETDFAAISKALHEIQFDGIATLELAFPNNFQATRDLKESWRMSRKFIQETFEW